MFKFKKVLMVLLAMLLLFSVITLAACRKLDDVDDGDGDGGGGGDDNVNLSDYSYNYGGSSANDGIDLEFSDTDMTVDGIVNASEYGNQYLSITDVNGVNMKVYAHLGNDGVFFGFVSNDTHVNYNTNNNVSNNTSVEVQVAANAANSSVVRLRLGANGTPELSQGNPSSTGYNYSQKYIQSMGAVHINGKLNDSAQGYSVEVYLPYTSIGLTEKPTTVVCAPSFNTLANSTDSQRTTWANVLGCDMSHADSWFVVNETGVTAHSAGYSEKNKGILQEKGGNEFYYFGMQPVSAYYIKTTLVVPTQSMDTNSRFGLVNKSDDALQAFYIDAGAGTNFGTVKAVLSATAGTSWQWSNNASTSLDGHWGNKQIASILTSAKQSLTLESIYYEGDLYYILGGVLVKTVKNFAPASEGAMAGLLTMNTKVTFSTYEYEADSAKVKTEVDKFLSKSAKIDGDLSDWTDNDVNKHARTVEDSTNGNSMTARAFRGTDGLYVALEITHKVNLTATAWTNWKNNTYIELYVNGSDEANHYVLTSFGNSGYMDGVMTTTNKGGSYSTVAEIFIPLASLTKDGFNASDDFKVGFAFKSSNGTANSQLNGKELWTLDGTPTTTQLTVLTKGIGDEYTLTYSKGSDDGVTGDAPTAVKVYAGDTIKLTAPTFTRDGYTFAGWTDGTNAYTSDDDFIMPNHDVTLTPNWVVSGATGEYSVTYEGGATDIEGDLPVDSNTYAPGELVTLMDTAITRDGYRFAGWTDGSKTYAVGSKIFMGGSDITLTAVWTKLYWVTYEAGAPVEQVTGDLPDSVRYAEGETVVVLNVAIGRSGYYFLGWKLKNSDTGYVAGDSFAMLGEDVTLTAVWSVKITLDGDLKDWNSINSKTIGAKAVGPNDNRRATWYGVLREDGLYLAVDIYHNNLGYGNNDWWKNLNFEIHLGKANIQEFVYINGRTGNVLTGYNYTIGTSANVTAGYKHSGGTMSMHHSTFEVFISNGVIAPLKEDDGSLRIGVAIKTDNENEKITGGTHNYGAGDPWYMPYGVRADIYDDFAYVTNDGMYLKNEYLHPDWQFGASSAVVDDGSIKVDGKISDWNTDHVLTIIGGQYYGKSATFYGKMTQAGLYLAVEVYHTVFTYGQTDWWKNTNFELRIGETFTNSSKGEDGFLWAKQYWVIATGDNTFAASESYMQMAANTEKDGNTYHTVIEIFISAANLVTSDYIVQNGMVHVGVAFKTEGDRCDDLGVDGGAGDWWVPKNTHINSNPACVTGNGIYTAKDYQSLIG